MCVYIQTKKEYAVKIFEKKSLLESIKPNRTRLALSNEINVMRNLNH